MHPIRENETLFKVASEILSFSKMQYTLNLCIEVPAICVYLFRLTRIDHVMTVKLYPDEVSVWPIQNDRRSVVI